MLCRYLLYALSETRPRVRTRDERVSRPLYPPSSNLIRYHSIRLPSVRNDNWRAETYEVGRMKSLHERLFGKVQSAQGGSSGGRAISWQLIGVGPIFAKIPQESEMTHLQAASNSD